MSYILPDQTKKNKDKEWHMAHVQQFIGHTISREYTDQKGRIQELYYAYLAIATEKEQKAIMTTTSPYGYDLGKELYEIYPLIESKIEQIVSIYMKRPMLSEAYVKDKKSVTKKLQNKISIIIEGMFRDLNKKINNEEGLELETPNPDIDVPENLDINSSKSYKEIAEEIANDFIHKFLWVDKNRQKIPAMLRDYLISERCHVVDEEKNGAPSWYKPHPLDVHCDRHPDHEVNRNHDYVVFNRYMGENEILNEFSLKASEKRQIKEYFQKSSTSASKYVNKGGINSNGWFIHDNGVGKVAVVEMRWKSQKEIKYKVAKDKYGKDIVRKMSKKDRVRKGEEKKIIDYFEPRHCIMLGPEICLSWGVLEERASYVENPTDFELGVTSIFANNPIGVNNVRSVAAKLYKLQRFASDILFSLNLAIKKNNGKVVVYDTAQTPKQFTKGGGNAINRVMHHAKKDQMILINSRDKKSRHAFNQFTSIDLSSRELINDLINGLALMEDLADKFIGTSPELFGQAAKYSTATATSQNTQASLTRMETYFYPFDTFIQAALEKMIMNAKMIYKEGDLVNYVFGDFKEKMIKVMSEFFGSDIGLYLADGSRNYEMKRNVDEAAKVALGSSQTPQMMKDLISILNKESATESEAILDKSIRAMEKMQQAEQEAAAKQEENRAKNEAAKTENEKQYKQDLLQNNKDVAWIYARNKETDTMNKIDSQERIKLAEIEKELLESNQNQNDQSAASN